MKTIGIVTSSLSNTMEWLDFGLFIFMAPLIGSKFFPQHEPHMATFYALMVFSVGFICRPLGGILFGHYGDTRGRANVLRISVLIISLPTLLIGILPTYEAIGGAAPVIFTLLRLLQGLSIGGEYSGVMVYLAESAPANKRGFITSFAAIGANLGFLLATVFYLLLNLFVTTESIHAWAWRLPFILAGLPGSLVIYYRFKLTETHTYQKMKAHHHIEEKPLITAIKYAPYQLLKIVGMTCMGSAFYYVFFGYMPTYLERFMGFSLKMALLIQSCSLTMMLIFVPLAGLCGDYFSRKKMLIGTSLGVILLVLPCFYLIHAHTIVALVLALGMAVLLSSLEQGNTLTAVVENCPENVRYSGIAFSYNLGNALFGGTAPLIVSMLTESVSSLAPSYYLILMGCITLFTTTTLLSHNKHLGILRSKKV